MEFNSEEELRTKLKEYINICNDNNINSTDFLIQRIEKSKVGNGMESFLEYIACETFKQKGYVVENQIPSAATVGSPDFGGYSLFLLNKYEKFNALFSNGYHIIELALLRFNNSKKLGDSFINGNIVGEAKTSTLKMASQLEKYLKTGLFEIGFEMHPSKSKPTYDRFGLLSFTSDNIIRVEYPSTIANYDNDVYSIEEYEKWLSNYLKFYLLANLSNDELVKFCNEKYGLQLSNINLVQIVQNISFEDLLSYIKEVI